MSRIARQPTSLFAATTVTAASTGPAHGTNTSPSEMPSRNPPPPARKRESRANGRSIQSASCGMSSVAATRKSRAIARLRRKSAGRPSLSSSHAANSVKTTKLATRPVTIRSGLRPVAPPASRIGSTGSTQGEIAVTTPARNPIPRRTITSGG